MTDDGGGWRPAPLGDAAGVGHGRDAGRLPLPFPREPAEDERGGLQDLWGLRERRCFDFDNAAFAAIFEFSWVIGVVAWPSCRAGVLTTALPGRVSGCEKNLRCRPRWVHAAPTGHSAAPAFAFFLPVAVAVAAAGSTELAAVPAPAPKPPPNLGCLGGDVSICLCPIVDVGGVAWTFAA